MSLGFLQFNRVTVVGSETWGECGRQGGEEVLVREESDKLEPGDCYDGNGVGVHRGPH